MTASKALVILNPAAGGGRGRRVALSVRAALEAVGINSEVVLTERPGHATELARGAAADGRPLVVAAGGDGTASEIASGIVGTGTVLALYPLGSGNDFSRALGYPRRVGLVPQFLADASERRIDVGEVNGRIFLNAAGVGIDGHVAERVEASARVVGRRLGYLVGSLASIARYRPQPMRVTIDGDVVEGKYLVVVASNGTHFGGGMHVAPRALLTDALLEVTLAGDLGRAASVVALARLYRGTHVNGTSIIARRAREIHIELDRELPMEHDGEVGHAKELVLRVRPAALRVLGA